MNVGFDGTLHPNGSTAQSTYSPVDENIAHKIRQTSPDVKGLLDSISGVAAMIGEFEEKSRERNYNVDSQKLRLDYAQAMSGEMNAMAMKQYADKDAFMRDYEQREANVREGVLSRARGDGENAGYFRNWSRYGNLVSQDLSLLGGKSRLNALTTYGNRQLNDYYKEIDSQYEQASVLGVNGFPIIDTMVDNDVRIPKANKEFAKSKMKSTLVAKTSRDNHEQNMRSQVFNDRFKTIVIQDTAGMKQSEYNAYFDNYYQNFYNAYELSVADNVALIEAQRDAAVKNLSGEQKEIVIAAYDEQIKEFKKAAELDKAKIRAQVESLRSTAEKEDLREFRLWKHEPGSVQLTRAGALVFKELSDEKTKSKAQTAKEKKPEEVLSAIKDYFGGNTNREFTNEEALEFVNTAEAEGVDFGANLQLKETESFVMANGIPMMIPDGVSYGSLSAEEQQKVLTHSISSSLCEDLAKCDPSKNLSTIQDILKKGQEWLTQEEYDKLKNFAIAIVMNDSPTKPSKEAMAQYQADLESFAISTVGVKKKEELREYPEASRYLAEAKAIMAAIPNDGAAQMFLTNFKIEFAKIQKQEASEIGFRNSYNRLSNRETYKDIHRVGVPKNEALPKPAGETNEYSDPYLERWKENIKNWKEYESYKAADTPEEEKKRLDKRAEEERLYAELHALELGKTEAEARLAGAKAYENFWEDLAQQHGLVVANGVHRGYQGYRYENAVLSNLDKLVETGREWRKDVADKEKEIEEEEKARIPIYKKLKELGLPLVRKEYNSWLGIGGYPINDTDEIELGMDNRRASDRFVTKEEGEEILRQYEYYTSRVNKRKESSAKRAEEIRERLKQLEKSN